MLQVLQELQVLQVLQVMSLVEEGEGRLVIQREWQLTCTISDNTASRIKKFHILTLYRGTALHMLHKHYTK